MLKPVSGETLKESSTRDLKKFQSEEIEKLSCNAVVIMSDGLNPYSLEKPDQVSMTNSGILSSTRARLTVSGTVRDISGHRVPSCPQSRMSGARDLAGKRYYPPKR